MTVAPSTIGKKAKMRRREPVFGIPHQAMGQGHPYYVLDYRDPEQKNQSVDDAGLKTRCLGREQDAVIRQAAKRRRGAR